MIPDYHFSNDWFAPNIPTFRRHLCELEGKPCRLLEVGTYEGRATTWLAHYVATHPQASIDTIDAVQSEKLRHNLDICPDSGKINFHLGMSDDVLRDLPTDFYDFAYIDGCHSAPNVLEDAILAFRLLKPNGDAIMAFDDYLWDDPNYPDLEGRPKLAIDAFLKIYAMRIEVLHRGHQVWLRKKAAARAQDNDFVAPEDYRRTPSLWHRASQRLRVARVMMFGH